MRLEPGTTKNKDGREVTMTGNINPLLTQCVAGKSADSSVLTRPDGKTGKRLPLDMGDRMQVCQSAGASLPRSASHCRS